MSPDKRIPKFSSEDEEREFWDTHDPDGYEWEVADDLRFDLPEKKKRVTIRLEPSLIAQLKELSAEVEIPYQTLTRLLIRRGLRQVERERAQRAHNEGTAEPAESAATR
ncbi:MAG: hypothetical protein GX131_03705 [candidate division WS1 bacterium]|jgi:predicted DNA binding CopG/RHH family protein|nr:hypothetical protein [candidate division WS1 bacterium]